MSKKIFITGSTGFLGACLLKTFSSEGYEILALKRQKSDTWRCIAFEEKILWINIEDKGWKEDVIKFQPNIIIHSAWEGVTAGHRDDWKSQMNNINLLIDLLELSNNCCVDKFIGLGSQAEYGFFDGLINESALPVPNNYYGFAKLQSMDMVKYFCTQKDINWIWLRLFPLFGEQESFDWFIPMLIKKINSGESIDMTEGKQKYAYLYVEDFADWLFAIAEKKIASGIYNISSSNLWALKEVVKKILSIMNLPNYPINFGVLPYRPNQAMELGGDTRKLLSQIENLLETDFDKNLEKTVRSLLASLNQ